VAFTVTNEWLEYATANPVTAATDIRAIVFTGAVPAAATIRDLDTVADALATTLNEAAASGYSRPDPTITVTPSDASDNLIISCPPPTLTSVAAGETWTAVGWYVHSGADSGNVLIGIDVPTPSTLTTDGENVILPALQLVVTGA
jgi:hypothetical protein